MWVLGYLVIPGQAVRTQSTASGISTLQIQTVQVKTGQHPSRVVHNPCRIHRGRLFPWRSGRSCSASVYNINKSLIFIHLFVGVTEIWTVAQQVLCDLKGLHRLLLFHTVSSPAGRSQKNTGRAVQSEHQQKNTSNWNQLYFKECEVGHCPLVSADMKYTQHWHTSHLPASQIYTIQSESEWQLSIRFSVNVSYLQCSSG